MMLSVHGDIVSCQFEISMGREGTPPGPQLDLLTPVLTGQPSELWEVNAQSRR